MEVARVQDKQIRTKIFPDVADALATKTDFTDLDDSGICLHTEDEEKYDELFGGGHKTKINSNVTIKSQAFEKVVH